MAEPSPAIAKRRALALYGIMALTAMRVWRRPDAMPWVRPTVLVIDAFAAGMIVATMALVLIRT
jgi:hypothetical protein